VSEALANPPLRAAPGSLLARSLLQAQALVGLRMQLFFRGVSKDRTWGRFALQLAALLTTFAASCAGSVVLYHQLAFDLARHPGKLAQAGGPLTFGAFLLGAGFALRAYFVLLTLAAGKPFLEPRRFLLYTVPAWLVSAINVVAQLFEPLWICLYPPALALILGLPRLPGAPGALPLAAALGLFILASAAFLFFCTALAAEVGSRKLLRRVFFALLVVGVVFVKLRGGLRTLFSLELDPNAVHAFLPNGWALQLAAALSEGRLAGALVPFLGLSGLALASAYGGHRMTLRQARRPEEEVRASASSSKARGWSVPLVSEPVAAILEKEVKTLLRAGWPQLLMMPASFLLLRFALLNNPAKHTAPGPEAYLLAAGYAHFSVLMYAVNQFGWDAEATRAWFLWPVRGRTVVLAKNAVAWAVSLLMFFVMCAVHLASGPRDLTGLFTGLAAHTATFPVLAAIGNASSIYYPSPMRGGQRRRAVGGMTGLVRMFGMLLLLLSGWAPYALSGALRLPLAPVYAGEVVAMGVVYAALLSASEALMRARREKLLSMLARDE
jgi:hypothetical protein